MWRRAKIAISKQLRIADVPMAISSALKYVREVMTSSMMRSDSRDSCQNVRKTTL